MGSTGRPPQRSEAGFKNEVSHHARTNPKDLIIPPWEPDIKKGEAQFFIIVPTLLRGNTITQRRDDSWTCHRKTAGVTRPTGLKHYKGEGDPLTRKDMP